MNGVRAISPNTFAALMGDQRVLEMLGEVDVGILRIDFSGKVLYRNEYMATMIGADTQFLNHRRWFVTIHPDDYMETISAYESTLKGEGQTVIHTSRMRFKDGDYRWVQLVTAVNRDTDGSGTWLTIVAPLPSTEIEARMERVMRDGETRYRALFDNASDAMLLIHDELIIDCNEAALSMYRGTREKLIGATVAKLTYDPAFDRKEVFDTLEKTGRVFEIRSRTLCLDGSFFESDARLVRITIGEKTFFLAVVRDITQQLQAAREREQMLQTLAERNQSLQWLQQASAQLFAQPSVQELGQAAIELLEQHYGASICYFGLLETDVVHLVACSRGDRSDYITASKPRYPFWDRVARSSNRILIIENIEEGLFDGEETRAAMLARGVTTLVLVLLLDGENELGVIGLEYYDHQKFEYNSLGDLEVFSRTLALALARARHVDAIEFQANHDSLTGLHNRAVLHREFQEWTRSTGAQAALYLLDLDRFKEINDTLGHHVGDDLLRQIGTRLRLGLSYRDAVVCRLGGDEFAVMLLGQAFDKEQAISLGRDLLTALRRPFLVNGVHLEISASIGVALYPEHGDDSHALLRSADVAMYEAKRGGAGVTFYDAHLDMHTPERLRLIVDLGNGIRERELVLHYQPKLDLRSGSIIGCEALVRWQHPRQGLLGPDRFIPFAEMSDTIHDLTAYVIDEACRQYRQWRGDNLELAVAVNLSARNLIDDRIVDHIERSIRQYDLAPGVLELEITETTLMHDPERAVQLLERIAALGVRLSIDDFGTGYSSLAYLRRLPINTLKIDRTFISEMLSGTQDAVIVQSIVTLAHNLGLEVVAEGVEGADVLDCLQVMGCDQAQGYYLSRPLPPTQLPAWLRQFSLQA